MIQQMKNENKECLTFSLKTQSHIWKDVLKKKRLGGTSFQEPFKMEKPEQQEVLLSESQHKVLMAFREHPDYNQNQVGKLLDMTQTKVSRMLRQIVKNNPDNFKLNREISLYNKAKKFNNYLLTFK